VDGDDIRVVQPSGRLGLEIEALLKGGRLLFRQTGPAHGLDRHRAIDQRIVCPIDRAHGTAAQNAGDFEAT